MATIYFDQRIWIDLLKAHKGIEPYKQKYGDVCRKVMIASDANNHKFPFSMWTLIETHKRTKLESRKELFQFIFRVSKFNTILPWVEILSPEIRNAILISVKKQPVNLEGVVFGEGIGHCFSSKEVLLPKEGAKPISEEKKKEIFSALRDPDRVADALSGEVLWEYIRAEDERDKEMTEKLEGLRKKYSHPDKRKQKDIADARFLFEVIENRFIREVLNQQLDAKEYIKQVFSSRENADNFLKQIPTAYVYHILEYARDSNKSRSIEKNDFADLGALAIAIPYCDVVVTEREWANILNKRGIGKLCNTRIIHDINELMQVL